MTEEFIEKYCKNCDRCIHERSGIHHFFPYPPQEKFVPTYCGEITEDGGSGTPLKELEFCIKGNQ